MRLDLRDIIHVPGAVKPFSFSFDLSDMDFYGQKPVCEPVQVEGKVVNRADMLLLEAVISSNLQTKRMTRSSFWTAPS